MAKDRAISEAFLVNGSTGDPVLYVDYPGRNNALLFDAGELHIRAVTVAGPLRCDNLKTRGRLLVDAARFEAMVRFWEARFDGWVEFKEVQFAECADFRSLHAHEGFLLASCRFHKDFLFRGATVCKKWEADRSRFDGLLDLSKAKLHDFVYLENI